jgi:NAD(P)-dependent dehydrogenase (short-subunit alcohol dehydrogenase family)
VNAGPRGRVVAVVGGDAGAGAQLAAGLADLGASVGSVGSEQLLRRDGFGHALDAVAHRLGPLDGVVVASVGVSPTLRGALAELDAAAWRDRVELPLHATLVCFQVAFDHLRRRGGTMVLVVPTSPLVGAAGFAPWAAVTEGQRALAKSAARAWGRHGVTVNCVVVPAALLEAAPDREVGGEEPAFDRPGQPAPALVVPDMRSGVAPVVHTLLSSAWGAVTGATVGVDGGVWMTP